MSQLSIRVDDDVKSRAETACRALGLSLSSAINVYLVKLGREQRIPFELNVDPFYSAENMEHLRRSIRQVESTGGTIHEVPSLD